MHPLLEEVAGPGRRGVLPEGVERLLEQVGTHGAEVAGEEPFGFEGLFGDEILHALEQAAARLGTRCGSEGISQ